MLAFLAPILNFLGGKVVGGLVDAYKIKQQALGDHEKLSTDLAGRALELDVREADINAKVVIAEQGHWFTRMVRPLLAMPVIILLFKILVYDKALGQWTHGRTDPLDPNLWGVVMCIIVSYMGGRTVEKVSTKIADVLEAAFKKYR